MTRVHLRLINSSSSKGLQARLPVRGHGRYGGLRLYRLNSWPPRSGSRKRLRASRNRWLVLGSTEFGCARVVSGPAGAGLRASLASRRRWSACLWASPCSHVAHHAIGSSDLP